MHNIIEFMFETLPVVFDREGGINATDAAAKFGERPWE